MYLWKIEKLKQVLAKRPLSQDEALKYLIYWFIVTWIASFWGAAATGIDLSEPKWLHFSASLTVFISEVVACYKLNGGKNGDDFLGRYFSVKLLTSIRLFFFALLIAVLIFTPLCWDFRGDLTQCFIDIPLYGKAFKYLGVLYYFLLRPLRIILHVKSINRSEVK